jgi:hypothetical protein
MISPCKRRALHALIALLAAVTIAHPRSASAATIGTCPSPPPEAIQQAVAAIPAVGTATTLNLRVADTYAKREYGLMCVRSLDPASGMIFVFTDGNQHRDFWMKNTLIPLDMLFVAKDGRVTSIAANVPATTVTTADEKIPRRAGTGTYVIELGAGDAAREHIAPGMRLDVSRITPAKE